MMPHRLKRTDLLIGLGLALFSALVLGVANHGQWAHTDYFMPLAQAFLDGRLHLEQAPAWLNELVPVEDRLYVVYPPAPALLLLPLIVLNGLRGFNQAWASIGVGAAYAALLYGFIVVVLGSRLRAVLLSVLMLFGTVSWFSIQLGTAWHFAHACALFFATAALLCWALGKPAWLVGLLWGMAALSRTAMLPGVLFLAFLFAADAYRFGNAHARVSLRWENYDLARLWRALWQLGLGLGLPLLAYGVYNAARFEMPWQTGHALIPQLAEEWQYRHGFFSWQSVPRNLYALFFAAPGFSEQPPYLRLAALGGLSIALTTPLFLWVLKARTPSYWTIGAWLSLLLVMVPVLLHADVGGFQYGYRYAQDIYPFLLALLMVALPDSLRAEHHLAIALGFAMSGLALWTQWNGAWL